MWEKITLLLFLLAMSFMATLGEPVTSEAPKERGKMTTAPIDPVTSQVPKENGKVNVLTLDSEKLEAIYYSSKDDGIHIKSEVRGDEYQLDVRNLAGEILVSVDHPDQSATTLTIMGHQFLILNNTLSSTQRYLTGYAVPAAYSKKVEKALKKKQVNAKMLRHLDFAGANQSRTMAMEELLNRPEIASIREAAEALGERRIIGSENPPVMPFYTLAMRLTKFQSKMFGENVDEENQITHREKRGHCWWSFTHCWNNNRCCRSCPIGTECLGMCGPGCNNCWWWVCGTCCYWGACYDHDVCCNNWDSWGCQVPITFISCNWYNCYSDSRVPW